MRAFLWLADETDSRIGCERDAKTVCKGIYEGRSKIFCVELQRHEPTVASNHFCSAAELRLAYLATSRGRTLLSERE